MYDSPNQWRSTTLRLRNTGCPISGFGDHVQRNWHWRHSILFYTVTITRKQRAILIEVYEGSHTSDKRSLLIAVNFKAMSLSLFSSNELAT